MLVTLSDKIRFIESIFGSGKLARNGKNIDVRCPICASKDVLKRKLAIRVDDDRNHCWACGWRAHTLAPLIKKYYGHEKLSEYVKNFMSATEKQKKQLIDSSEEEPRDLKLPVDFKLLVLASDFDPDTRAVKKYLALRGLSERDLWYFKLGISNEYRWRRRVIVPSFDSSGKLNYFVGRTIDDRVRPKYDNPDIDKLPIIFNELNIDWTKELVLCEGTFDMFKCGDNVVPLLGSDLNECSALFNTIVANSTPVILALDGDMWDTKTPKLFRKLREYDVNVKVADIRPYGDPGNASSDQLQQAFVEAKQIEWIDVFSNKLNRVSKTSLSV